MAVIEYKCNICNRTKNIPENITGLDVIGRCTITAGCRGELIYIKRHADYVRGNIPPRVSGLTDWSPRNVFFEYTQTIPSDEWHIEHNLNSTPIIIVYSTANNEIIEITPRNIIIVNHNVVNLEFDQPTVGIAHIISRSTNETNITISQKPTIEYIPITFNNTIAIASTNTNVTATITAETNPDINQTITFTTTPLALSPWVDKNTVIIQNQQLHVLFSSVSNHVEDLPTNTMLNITFDNDAFILLAKEPFKIYDKLKDVIVHSTNINPIFNLNGILTTTTKLTTIYPHIQ